MLPSTLVKRGSVAPPALTPVTKMPGDENAEAAHASS
jgi:hypothetical protein